MKPSTKTITTKPAPKPAKKSAFWEDDDDEAYGEDLKAKIPPKPMKKSTPPAPEAKKPTPPPPVVQAPIQEEAPKGPPTIKQVPMPTVNPFNIRCGEDRVLITDVLDSEDVQCYHYRLRCTMHLKRKDLSPAEDVFQFCAYIRNLPR